MTNRRLIGSVALLALLTLATAGARAEGEGKYPDWGGQWVRPSGIQFDPTKPLGRGQQAPLTPEYQAKFEAGLADQAAGGQGERARFLPAARHAAHDERVLSDGVHRPAEHHLHPVRGQSAAPHLYRRARLAGRDRADLRGLFDRQMDR